MPDPKAMRGAVEMMMTRLLAGGETDLAEQLVHPAFVNNEADPERRQGPSGAAATSEWLRSCFGNLRYDIHRVFIDGVVHLFRFADDGRVVERSAVRDDLGMVMQLGLLPPPV